MQPELLLGGMEQCSFIDFPGLLSAVVFARGCNLRCAYCHNPQLLEARRAPGDADAEEVLAFLETRRGLLGGVVVSGGEPTLQPEALKAFLRRARALGFKAKLDTNGTRPELLAQLLEADLVDYVALDFKDLPEGYADLCGLREPPAVIGASLAVLRRAGKPYELRTTVAWPRHGEARLRAMAGLLACGERWFLQRYRPGQVLDPTAGFTAPDTEALRQMAERFSGEFGIACAAR